MEHNNFEHQNDTLRVLREVFYLENLRNGQEEAIGALIREANSNILINMASRAGKSLCYQLPGLLIEGVKIIFSPSLALINDQMNYLRSLNIEAESINGNVLGEARDEIIRKIRENTTEFFFLTPEMASQISDFLTELIEQDQVGLFVVDEAHKIIDSAGYRDFSILGNLRMLNEDIPWLALTTSDETTQNEIAQFLNMENTLFLSSSSVITNIQYESIAELTAPGETIIDFLNGLSIDGRIPSGIIFCRTASEVDRLNNYLTNNLINSECFYGNHVNREINFNNWATGNFPVLIATGDSLGYGLHYQMPAVRFVIHYGMPDNLRSFYHESSHAGNDENLGFSRVYHNFSRNADFESFHNSFCKRQFLAQFFGEAVEACVNRCDSCLRRA